MLAQIKGILEEKQPHKVFINLGSVVLEILIPLSLYENLPQKGKIISLYTSMKIKGDTLVLYGFKDFSSKELFEQLQKIPQVGPRLALSIISVFTPEQLLEIVHKNDTQALALVPGIGPKRAERFCVELKSRLKWPEEISLPKDSTFEEALSALINLGFSPKEARLALERVYKQGENVTILIKKALKELSGAIKAK